MTAGQGNYVTVDNKGLKVRAGRDPEHYQTGVKITNQQLAAVPLSPHDWHGEWNYTISPTAQSMER